MKVTVKYFGMIAEKIGKTEETIEIIGQRNINLRSFFEQEYPELNQMNYKIAVNQILTEIIPENSENVVIALLPPFAGG